VGNDNVVKKKREGAPVRAVAKRRPFRDLEVGRQIRSFTYHFAKREIRDKRAFLATGRLARLTVEGQGYWKVFYNLLLRGSVKRERLSGRTTN